jgi:FtsH-binding integral membrane protein
MFGVTLFLVGAAVAWMVPVGPMYWAVGWTPLLLIAALLALVFVGVTSSSRKEIKRLRTSPYVDGKTIDGEAVVVSRSAYGQAISTALLFFLWFLTGFILLSLIFGLN